MAVTDQEVLSDIQQTLIETDNSGASWSSGHWTTDEVIDYLNQRQDDFLKQTMVLSKRATINTIPRNLRHTLPSDWIATRRVVWKDADGDYTPLPRSDSWDQDHTDDDWTLNPQSKPDIYTDGETQNLAIQVSPPASEPGILEILYAYVGATLSNTGVSFTAPDVFIPSIKWGVVADMLSKVGRAQDLQRAQWAESRYQMGVEAGRLIVRGWY